MKSAGNSSSHLFCALKNLLDFGIRLIHCFRGRQRAAVGLRKKDSEGVFDFGPLWRARAWPRTFERAQLRGIRRIFCDQLGITKDGFARGWSSALRRLFH